jgi:hypothetical protein
MPKCKEKSRHRPLYTGEGKYKEVKESEAPREGRERRPTADDSVGYFRVIPPKAPKASECLVLLRRHEGSYNK